MHAGRSPATYRTIATRVAYRWPVFTAVGTQVVFWVLANTMLNTVVWSVVSATHVAFPEVHPFPFLGSLVVALVAALLYGVLLGLVDVWMDRRLSAGSSLGVRILVRGLLYSAIFVVISALTVTLFEHFFVGAYGPDIPVTNEARVRWAFTFAPTTLVGNFLISFIRQTNRSFGPGLLTSLLLGRYRDPVPERRVFLFMDLKGSTTHAEELGPERYSAMVRDLFHDVDGVVPRFEAEIYQYVGDEVVFTWNAHALRDARRCLLFFLAVDDAIRGRWDHYQRIYGRSPAFKAGLHVGGVIAVEIGDIKREIAYHGDTINTAARIQGMSNAVGHPLLISDDLLQLCGDLAPAGLRSTSLGSVVLRGRHQGMAIHAIERAAPSIADR
ncbi:MAG: adenylate/guanylate cyclase domain-containing protein [Bacteroidetes bacterium]|nr:adenylate/guanylate cyclase domain-containing protein [Bacteroidota bacterium]